MEADAVSCKCIEGPVGLASVATEVGIALVISEKDHKVAFFPRWRRKRRERRSK
jgi:hypothetical protein